MADAPRSRYRYYDLVLAGFVTVYLCSNLIGPAKAVSMWGLTFGAGFLFFPLSYIFGDILTEVYGYARARRVIWAGFGAMAFASLMATVVVALPPADGWPFQDAYEVVFTQTPRIVLASLIAFWSGEFVNSYIMAKMKVWMAGRHLWMRTIGSTIAGQGVDSLLFYPIAFYGVWDEALIAGVLATNYVLKVMVEVAMTPVTYKVVAWLKRTEHEDFYDQRTDFNPFTLKT